MNIINLPNKKARNTPINLLMLAFIFSYLYIDVGFALKPFMLLSVVFLVFSLKGFEIHKLKLFEISLLTFFGYYCSTGFFAEYSGYSLRLTLGIILVIFCYFVMRYILSLASIEGVEKAISFSGIVFNGLSLIWYFVGLASLNFVIAGNKLKVYGLMMDRGFPRLKGIIGDPNVFCFYNFIFFFYFVTHLDKKWAKLGFTLTSATMILSFSRGGIIAVGLGLIMVFLSFDLRKKIKMAIILPISFFILNIIINLTMKIDVMAMFTERFLSSSDDGGSGRSFLWSNGLIFLKENPIFGIGLFNYRAYSEALYGSAAFMHNTFMDALVEGGIVGLVLYVLIFVIFGITYLSNRKQIKDRGYIFFSLISMTIFMTTYSLMTHEAFFIVMAIMWRYLYEIKVRGTVYQKIEPHKPEVFTKKPKSKRYKLVW